jgi:hypothetical protein
MDTGNLQARAQQALTTLYTTPKKKLYCTPTGGLFAANVMNLCKLPDGTLGERRFNLTTLNIKGNTMRTKIYHGLDWLCEHVEDPATKEFFNRAAATIDVQIRGDWCTVAFQNINTMHLQGAVVDSRVILARLRLWVMSPSRTVTDMFDEHGLMLEDNVVEEIKAYIAAIEPNGFVGRVTPSSIRVVYIKEP